VVWYLSMYMYMYFVLHVCTHTYKLQTLLHAAAWQNIYKNESWKRTNLIENRGGRKKSLKDMSED
jgi:hypothetical protein